MALLVLLLLFLIPGRSALGQTPSSGSLGIERFGIEQGLPGFAIQDLEVTRDGLLWVVASGRLASFDGLVFQEHLTDPSFAWDGGRIVAVGEGRGDTLWVGAGHRLFSYAGGRAHLRARSEEVIRDVWQDASGRVWAWDQRGALRLGDDGFERVVELADRWQWGQLTDRPGDPEAVQDGIALLDRGLGATRRIDARALVQRLRFPDDWPVPVPGGIWERPRGASVELREAGGEWTRVLPAADDEEPLLLDRRGLLWTGVPGAVHALGSDGRTVASLALEPDARVDAVHEDAEGDVWLGTQANGLYRIRPLPVRILGAAEGLTDGEILRVSDGGDGRVLVLDDEGGLERVGPTRVDTLFEPSAEAGSVTAAVTDHHGTLWTARVRGSGITLRGRTADGRDIRVPLPGVAHRIVEDPVVDGRLWLGGWNLQTVRFGAPGGPVVEDTLLLKGWSVRDLLVDSGGIAWVAAARGIARVSDAGVEEFLGQDGFPTDDARALHLDADGTLWIGRYGGGIVRYRDGRFQAVGQADGLWDGIASSLLEDDAGNFWMGSNSGIHRVARSELRDFLDGRIDRVRGRGYGASDGFRNPEASGWPAYRSSDGRLWFPTFSGLAVVDPAAVLARERQPPRVRILGLRTGSERLPVDAGGVRLPLGSRRFDVQFGAIALSGQEGMRYEVRLDGVDPGWVDVGQQRQVTYGNVPPGRQTLRVRAVNGAGVTSANVASVVLTVPPFFTETWSFRLLLAAAAGLALVGLFVVRGRRHRAREANLQRLVDERTADLVQSQAETESALATVEAQAADLRSLDEAKSRFFANVSHELRTPLTLVVGPLQDVLDGRLGPAPDAVKEQVEVVLSSGRRLGQIVEQLLDVARLEAGELRLDVREHDVKPLLERLASSFSALARSRNVTLDVTLPTGAVEATLDADRMEKVWANLLSNALKFTPEGGRVRFVAAVAAGDDGDQLTVYVEDDGPGIAEEDQDRIFERFHQVDGSARRSHGGTGLGLALVREITELHGGTVEVWSDVGRGSRFTVRVPLAGPGVPAVPPDALLAEAAVGPDAPRIAPLPDAPVTMAPPGSPALTAPGRSDPTPTRDDERPTVLVVEDHDELRAYLRRHLEGHYRVAEARDGREGLAEARRSVPDLVLCDIMMPGMDGEEMCRAIRSDPELDFLPVIMVTARASRPSRLSALEGGADDYLVKPFDPEELRLRVRNVLASRKRLRERLLEEGKALPFVELEMPRSGQERDFAEELGTVLSERLSDEELDAEAIAGTLAMSRATLYRKTREALGTSPIELLWELRLRQAAHWLDETDANVSEVAYACGFKTVPHFTRRFREAFGTTPAAWRRDPSRGTSSA